MTTKGNLGLGVMINMLGGNEETVNTHKAALDKVISDIKLKDSELLLIKFTDNTGIKIYDDGQSCCESRYMTTDDELPDFIGAKFTGAELRDVSTSEMDWGEHETQFLIINTDKGSFTMENHNEHNGYYGGFWIVIKPLE